MKEQNFWNELKSGKFANMVKESSKGQALNNAQEVYNIMKPLFMEQDDVESLYGIFLNTKNRVIAIEKLFSGSITGAPVYPREIVKRVLALKASAFVMVHNHPSGDPTPSSEDLSITLQVFFAANSIGAAVHDHIVVGDGYYSMGDRGDMARMKDSYNHTMRDI